VATRKSASSKSFPLIIGAIAIVGVGALGYVLSRPQKVVTLDPSLPPVTASGFIKGNPNAAVQVVEFADFECPGCGQFATVTEPDVMSRFVETGEISFRFMDYPLTEIHPNAVAAHNAAHCAGEQEKFWPMHDQIFLRQHEWNTQATRSPKRVLETIAQSVGLDMGKWNDCFDTGRMLPVIAANRAEALRMRASSTPTFIFNDRMVSQVLTFDQFRQLVTEAKVAALAAESAAKKTP
jgi:protein-disulfide isomerase